MSILVPEQRGMYFEDFEIGQRIGTAGRTITEADVVNFAGLSGDFNQIHMDMVYSETTAFGKRVAHGLLVLSVASGLIANTGVLEGTVLAFREIGTWKFVKPVFIGDTIHVEVEVAELRSLRRIGGGTVTIIVAVKNQHNDVVMKGTWKVIMACRSG